MVEKKIFKLSRSEFFFYTPRYTKIGRPQWERILMLQGVVLRKGVIVYMVACKTCLPSIIHHSGKSAESEGKEEGGRYVCPSSFIMFSTHGSVMYPYQLTQATTFAMFTARLMRRLQVPCNVSI